MPFTVSQMLAQQLESFVWPLLLLLDAYLDKRLVRTFLDLLSITVQVRYREQRLVLNELGATLLSPNRTNAGAPLLACLSFCKTSDLKI